MTNNFNCTVYPTLGELDDNALGFAWARSLHQLQNNNSALTYAERLEAAACCLLLQDLRWETYGRANFQAMVNREFGDLAITVS